MKNNRWYLIVKPPQNREIYDIINRINSIELRSYIYNIEIAGEGSSHPGNIVISTKRIPDDSTIFGFLVEQIKQVSGAEIEMIKIEIVDKSKLRKLQNMHE